MKYFLRCLKLFPAIFVFLLSLQEAFTTHNLAGQITARRLQGNTYEITLTTYTDPAPAGVDRCSADIEVWTVGPNQQLITILEDIPRGNGPIDPRPPIGCEIQNSRRGVEVYITVKRNIYTTTISLSPGNYELRYYDPTRREDIINITRSVDQTFYLETRISIPNPILGFNNTPILLNTPLDEACIGKYWTHNPGGFDPDGDSLAYKLRESYQYNPVEGISPQKTNGYRFPDAIFNNGPLTMNPITGLMTWDRPVKEGVYNIAYEVEEWRNGVKLGYVVRDMVIIVKKCKNDPPVIEAITDTCVIAGKTLRFDFEAYDPNGTDSIYLKLNNDGIGNNGPFSVSNKPIITGFIIDKELGRIPFRDLPISTANKLIRFPDTLELIDTIKGTFVWNTVCDNIRKQFYQVDFFANDNLSYIGRSGTTLLTANHLVAISVIPPPPGTLRALKSARSVTLSWDPSSCDNAIGYNIFRKIGTSSWNQDTVCCQDKPLQSGYELIQFSEGWDKLSYTDDLEGINVLDADSVCYLITAVYRDNFNPSIDDRLESCTSNQVCISIESDKLYITNDSVSVTDASAGVIFVSWSQPKQVDSFYPVPLTYRLYRKQGESGPFGQIASLSYTDTTYLDRGLNTEDFSYSYKIRLYDAQNRRIPTGDTLTQIASSIYLTTRGDNGTITLSWQETVPWSNTVYEIYRAEGTGNYSLLANIAATGTDTHTYIDRNLANDTRFCYFIRSRGAYLPIVPGIKPLLINDSQVSCEVPSDKEAPCLPELFAQRNCDENVHEVRIVKQTGLCDEDGKSIILFISDLKEGTYTEKLSLPFSSFGKDTTISLEYEEGSIFLNGCYAIQTEDLTGNVSELSEPVCVENCPNLRVGNLFSPNGDGINDVFTPLSYRDVDLIRFTVYDRWGRVMKDNLSNIDILWDGSGPSATEAAEGVYYYHLEYREKGADEGSILRLVGWVTLLR